MFPSFPCNSRQSCDHEMHAKVFSAYSGTVSHRALMVWLVCSAAGSTGVNFEHFKSFKNVMDNQTISFSFSIKKL